MSELKTCFVIAPIGEPDSDTRKRSDKILKHVITPATNECGYKPLRADQISEPGIITRQIIQHIIDDPLVIADLTGRNPNVFYELAIRHAIRKPLIQIISNDEQLPFDVANTRTIKVDYRDLDSVSEAKIEIVKQINAVIKDPSKVDTPISMSLDLQNLKQSEVPEQRSLADLIESVSIANLGIKNIQTFLESESVLQDKKNFRDIAAATEVIKERVRFASNLLRKMFEKFTPENLDKQELSKREREWAVVDNELFAVIDMIERLQKMLRI
jgi:hypothetical protein